MVPDVGGFDLHQVEVLRGPQGTLYGANTLNGVVRVQTNDANLDGFEFKARTSAATTEGGGESYRGDAAINVPIVEGKVAARATLGYAKSGGWIDTLVKRDVNDTQLGDVRLKLNAQPNDKLSVGLSYWHSSTTVGAPNVATNQDVYPAVMDNPSNINFDAVGLKLGYDFQAFSASSMTSYIDYRNHGRLDITPFSAFYGVPSWYGEVVYNELDSKVLAQEVNLTSTGAGPWRWTLGGFYRDAEDHTFEQASYFIPSIDYGDKSSSFAVFGELTRRFMDGKLELTGGLRYFDDRVTVFENAPLAGALPGAPLQHDVDTFSKVTHRAILAWHPTDRAMVYASYGTGFRSGFSQAATVKLVAPNFGPAKPDTLYNYELGSRGSFFGGRVTYDTAIYYMDWKDVQQGVVVQFGAGGAFAIVNGQTASGLGFDFQTDAHLPHGFELGASLSWNDLAFDQDVFSDGQRMFGKGDRLSGSVETTIGASAGYVFPMGGTGLRGHFSVSGSYHTRQTNRALIGIAVVDDAGDNMTNVQGRFSLESQKNWTAEVFVDNASDSRANLMTTSSNPFYQLRIRPRTIGLQFEYKY